MLRLLVDTCVWLDLLMNSTATKPEWSRIFTRAFRQLWRALRTLLSNMGVEGEFVAQCVF